MKTYLKLKTNPTGRNNLEVSVRHNKARKCVEMHLQVGDCGGNANFVSFTYMMFRDPSKFVELEKMQRFSQKKFDAIVHDVKLHLSEKFGPTWDAIVAFLKETNLELE